MGADTYHDFQTACAVGVVRAVSTPWHGATRRIGNSSLGVHSPIHTIFLTLCLVWRKEFSSILPVLNIIMAVAAAWVLLTCVPAYKLNRVQESCRCHV